MLEKERPANTLTIIITRQSEYTKGNKESIRPYSTFRKQQRKHKICYGSSFIASVKRKELYFVTQEKKEKKKKG